MGYYDELAEGYAELHGEEQSKKATLVKSFLNIPKDSLILDVGCGTGIAAEQFDCRKVGIDPSLQLLKKASFPAVQGIAEALPFKDETFDFVISLTAIQNFDDIEKGLKGIKRVGKKFVLSFLKKSQKAEAIDKAIRQVFSVEKVIDEEKDFIYFC